MSDLDKIFSDGIEAMRKLPAGTTLGEILENGIRNGDPGWIDTMISDAKRYRFSDVWTSLLDTAARVHPDWYIRDNVEGPDKYQPRRRAKEQTRKEVVAWYIRRDPESALRIRNAWCMEPDA